MTEETQQTENEAAGGQSRAGEAGANLTAVLAAGAYPATRTVHCPSGPTHACDEHAAQITGLMHMLGAHVAHTVAPAGAQCENCANEAANCPHEGPSGASREGPLDAVVGPQTPGKD